MGALTLDRLSLTYPQRSGAFLALAEVSLSIPDGEFVTIVGPSGCGKSTLLMLIAALLRPTAGSVRLDGRVVTAPGSDRALVFQDFALLPWRTDPAVGRSRAAISISKVLLPQPDGPTMVTNSPSGIARLTSASARKAPLRCG